MKLIKKYIPIIILLVTVLMSCENEVNRPQKIDSTVPPIVTNIKVENLRGGAKISYTLPNDHNIAYVLAKYKLPSGIERVDKSSVFKNYVELEGFAESRDYTINLYTVSKSEIQSEPVEVIIHPQTAPIILMNDSFTAEETFGGVLFTFSNPDGIPFILHTYYKDESGTWVEADRYYSEARQGLYAVRGFQNKPIDFRFFFTDEWQNSSDTTEMNLTPLYEEEFDKSLWSDAALSDDTNAPRYTWAPLSRLWTPGAESFFFVDPNIPGLALPHWFTIDLGKRYLFGRMVIHLTSHNDGWMYAKGAPENFQIWGANERTTDWEKWTLLGDFTVWKPSELPVGQVTQEDRDQIFQGHDFQFPPSNESFRYVRFVAVQNFGLIPETHLLELTFFGRAVE